LADALGGLVGWQQAAAVRGARGAVLQVCRPPPKKKKAKKKWRIFSRLYGGSTAALKMCRVLQRELLRCALAEDEGDAEGERSSTPTALNTVHVTAH
jgi:hypothetical protein